MPHLHELPNSRLVLALSSLGYNTGCASALLSLSFLSDQMRLWNGQSLGAH